MNQPTPPLDTRLVIGPNASLTPRQAWACLAVAAGGSLVVAGVWTWLGFWPVLPFAGLELAALGAALYVAMRENRQREVIEFTAKTVRLDIGSVGVGPGATHTWPRGQVRVFLERGPHRNSHNHLYLARGQRRIEIGRWLTDTDRARLASRLKALIVPGWSAPDRGPETDMEPPALSSAPTNSKEIGGFNE